MPVWLAVPVGGLKLDMVPIVIPFAKWQYSANDDEFLVKPRKI